MATNSNLKALNFYGSKGNQNFLEVVTVFNAVIDSMLAPTVHFTISIWFYL